MILLSQTASQRAANRVFSFSSMKPLEHTLSVFILALWVAGCGRNLSRMKQQFDNGKFESAVDLASDDRALTRTLAVWIVRDAALEEEAFGMEAVELLARAGAPGEAVLDDLSTQDTVLGRLAEVARYDDEMPDEKMTAFCVGDDHGDVRAACMKKHHETLPKAILRKSAMDTDPRVRLYAVRGLIGQPQHDEETSVLLSEVLRQDPSSKVRAEASSAASILGKDAYLQLKAALDDPNQGVRLAVLKGIAALGSGIGFKRLETIAQGPIDMMAVAAAAELSRVGNAVGRTRLDAALRDSRPTIRIAAMMRLERARYPERTTKLTSMLKDSAPDVVLLAANLLRQERSVRHEVVAALGRIASDGGSRRGEARDQLAVLGDAQAVVDTREALADAKESVLLLILGRIQDAESLRDDVAAFMGDARPAVRLAAAKSIL